MFIIFFWYYTYFYSSSSEILVNPVGQLMSRVNQRKKVNRFGQPTKRSTHSTNTKKGQPKVQPKASTRCTKCFSLRTYKANAFISCFIFKLFKISLRNNVHPGIKRSLPVLIWKCFNISTNPFSN